MAQETDRHDPTAGANAKSGNLASHEPPGDHTTLYDSNLRLTLALINASDWYQLAARTGIVWQGSAASKPEPQFLNLFVELNRAQFGERDPEMLQSFFKKFQLRVPGSYLKEFARNPALRTIPARIQLDPKNPSETAEGTRLDSLLAEIVESRLVTRLRSAVPHGQNLERSLGVIDLPQNDCYKNHSLTGNGVVIGIIDDGCALAHPDLLRISSGKWYSRVLSLWDQSQLPLPADPIWTGSDLDYGRELKKSKIDLALAKYPTAERLDEDDVYAKLRYSVGEPGERATHGTKVTGIAAGNGNSLMGWRGVAPEADIIFVQLPPDAIREAPQLLSKHIVDGVAYIFDRAAALGKPAVVNISYGGYSGSHDGTSAWELAIDELLALDDRAVVVSAGNGFEADCHSMGTVKPGNDATLRWMLQPWDTTINDLEIWYNGDAELEITLVAPDGTPVFGPKGFCSRTDIPNPAGKTIGSIEHVNKDASNGDNMVLIALGSTHVDAIAKPLNAPLALVDSGTWKIRLQNAKGGTDAEFHAWIRRDDLGGLGTAHQQSRFAAEDAWPEYTLCDMATGKLTIAAGAFNAATNEVCAYSACGPTRASTQSRTQSPNPSRQKPDIYAPAEELANGAGVLTSASRSAPPWRLNGTSAAAPHVTGIVALVFEYFRKRQTSQPYQPLSVSALLTALSEQPGVRLVVNRRASLQARKRKQADVWNDLVVPGKGEISCINTLDKI